MATQRDQLMKQAKKHSRLAFIYADDGAFATAAKILRETAELFDAEHHRILNLLNPSLAAQSNVGRKRTRGATR